MKNSGLIHGIVSIVMLVCLCRYAAAQSAALQKHKTENVIVVMIDGMRWQEIFRGADAELFKTKGPEVLDGSEKRAATGLQRYGQGSASERRKALMPFLWSTVARDGQIYGNRDLGSDAHVTNGLNFSYPGYSEALTGIADPRVNSNDNTPNPNRTVFEWLSRRPGFTGKVGAFGAWNVFTGIFNAERCKFPVNAAYDPMTAMRETPELKMLNTLKSETVRIWPDESFDPLPFRTAMEFLKVERPRLLFIGLGETDDWAHSGSYPEYLNAAYLADGYLRELWEFVQSTPQYRDKTTLIILPDHGRGNGGKWTGHGQDIPESMQTWMAFLGPDSPALGERGRGTTVTENEMAATMAALLGEDYRAAEPKAGAVIEDVLGRSGK